MSTSKLQQKTSDALHLNFGHYSIRENIRPDWLITDRGERIELDFYIEQIEIAIEVQGLQHFEHVPHFHPTLADFNAQKRRDKFKAQRCDDYGVWLFEVFDDLSLETAIGEIQYIIKTGRKREPRKVREFWNREVNTLTKEFKQLQADVHSISLDQFHARFQKLQSRMMKTQAKYVAAGVNCVGDHDSAKLLSSYQHCLGLLEGKRNRKRKDKEARNFVLYMTKMGRQIGRKQ